MEKIKLYALTFATIAMSLVSCVKKEENHLTPDEIFHVVHFETESSETKTTMDIDGTTVNFAWEETDYDAKLQRFHIWENENKAFRVEPVFNDGKLTLDAAFSGDVSDEPEYVGYFNGKVPALQVPRNNQYDADADVLIAESRKEEDQFVFYFQRVVAIGKLTLKGIEAGETLQSVTFELAEESDQFLTASLERSNESSDGWAWEETGKKMITLNCNHKIVGESSPALFFTCVPVNEGMFTVKAVTDKNTYSKTFGRAISLTRGNVKGMTVTVEKEEKPESTFTISVSTFKETGNKALNQTYADTRADFSTHGYQFSCSNIITPLAGFSYGNRQTANIKSDEVIQFRKSPSIPGVIANTSEISLKEIKVYYFAWTTFGATMSVGNLSSSLSTTLTNPSPVDEGYFDKNVDRNAADPIKSVTYNVAGYKYFSLKNGNDNATFIKKIEITYGESTPTGVKLATPANLSVNADKQIVWDRVENAGGYNVYVDGVKKNDQFLTEHYYNAEEVADGYYNVAVEAVPANSEMFTTSDKATLTSAKFGTPTLAAPEYYESSTTDVTASISWFTIDHASAGYSYILYAGQIDAEHVVAIDNDDNSKAHAAHTTAENGDIQVLSLTNLRQRTTYYVTVQANAVTEGLTYEASQVVSSEPLTTKATVTYATIENGTFADANPTYAVPGSPVEFVATPATGYEFSSATLNGGEGISQKMNGETPVENTYTFTMPDVDESTVAVTFAQSGFTLGTSLLNPENDHGTVVIDSPKERYTVTDVIALTVTPDDYYECSSVSAMEVGEGNGLIEAKLNEETRKYEIKGLHFNAELVAYFNKINYAIAVAEGIANGTVTRGSETATYNQENVSFTVKPDSGYQISTVTVSGTSGDVEVVAGATDAQGTHYTFTMPGEPVTIAATFAAIVYNLTDNSGENGSLSFKVNDAAATTATIGQPVTITVTPEDYYQLVDGSVKVNGIAATKVDATIYEWVMTAAPAVVTAQFEKIQYELSDQSGSHGSIVFKVNGSAASSATFGQSVTVEPTPISEDYILQEGSLLAYKKGDKSTVVNMQNNGFSMPGHSVSVAAEFIKKTFTFSTDPSSDIAFDIQNNNGTSIKSLGSISGETIKLVASNVPDGKCASWLVTYGNNVQVTTTPVDGSEDDVTFTMPIGNVTIKCIASDPVSSVVFGSDWNTLFGTEYSGSFNTKANNLFLSGSVSGVSMSVVNGTSTSGFVQTSDFRAYNGYTIKFVAPSGKNITSISTTKGGKNYNSGITVNVGSGSISENTYNWNGSANTVVLTISGTVSFATITVGFSGSGSEGGEGGDSGEGGDDTPTEPSTDSWDLTSASSAWTASLNESYFSQPYGYKKANGTLTNKSISDFSDKNIKQIKVGFKCLQNGGTTSKLTIYLVDKNGNTLGSGVVVTPDNKSAASQTTYKYATFTTNLSGATGFMMKVTTFGKNILINGAEYEVQHTTDK